MTISAITASILITISAQTTEIYNKNNNKLDLYKKINTKHYFSSNNTNNNDTTYTHLGFKNETQINNQLTDFNQ